MKILSLEDDLAHAELIQVALQSAGHDVHTVSSGRLAIRHLETAHVDLLMLDWRVRDLSGPEVLDWVRIHLGDRLPILFLTCRTKEDEASKILDAGADGFMTKPVKERDLAATVNALLRRAYPETERNPKRIEVGAYVVDIQQRTVTVHGRPLTLTRREFDLAVLLFRSAGEVVLREQLWRVVWGREADPLERSLDTHVSRLRRKMELGPQHSVRLRTLHQLGYRLEVGC